MDISGNTCRIITLVDYARQTVLIPHVMDHKSVRQRKARRKDIHRMDKLCRVSNVIRPYMKSLVL